MRKANTLDKENAYLDLNIKVIGSDGHTSVYKKHDDFGSPIVNFPYYVTMFLDSHRTVFTFLSW